MWKADNEIFSQLDKACGSRYFAILFISQAARRLLDQKDNWSIESKLISWVITGEKPPVGIHLNVNPEMREISDFLCYIPSDDMKQSVIDSYHLSVRNRHLIYNYNPNFNESEKARVRVLLRMIWYLCT